MLFLLTVKIQDQSTLKRPVNLLKENKTVGIFPTGHRTSAEGAPLKRGASTIVIKVRQSANLPAAYVGPKYTWLNYWSGTY